MSDDPTADANLLRILNSPSYRRADVDLEFLAQPELRPVRIQMELLKPELGMVEQKIRSTIVLFGSTQIVALGAAEKRLQAAEAALRAAPADKAMQREVECSRRLLDKCKYYDDARAFARIVSEFGQRNGEADYVVMTGGGPGIMEAGNRGAFDVGAKSIGLNIHLPAEQQPNSYVTPELCYQFRYFALRKMHFLLRAKALIVFPGGFGTMDELLDALTLRQTDHMQRIPIVMYGREYWQRAINFQFLADEGTIDDEDLALIDYADSPAEAWEIIARFHHHAP